MNISQTTTFTPITITLDTPEEAMALKAVCTDRAIRAACTFRNFKLNSTNMDAVLAPVHRALDAQGIKYLNRRS